MARKIFFTIIVLICFASLGKSQSKVTSPQEFLGYSLGDEFTPHFQVAAYFKKIALESDQVKLVKYGETYEGRPLMVAFVSSKENISNIEDIRINNLKKAGMVEGAPIIDNKVIVWLSYNVHGNEASSTEAAMATLYELVSGAQSKTEEWLENTVVVVDPCINPDGRDRYVNWYKENRSSKLQPNLIGADHLEPWPGGRMNHYLFDLNRDWVWLSQQESVFRLALYNKWLPQIHVDFHEQGFNNPYYFAPAAKPYHALISEWQKEFQVEIGKNNAGYFDSNHWLYFTKERFDLFYPGYGDTYPIFNGAIGMTYEQAGGGVAGLGIKTETKDTLTLYDRMIHHYTTSLSTIEISSRNAGELEHNFIAYFNVSNMASEDMDHSYIIRYSNGERKIKKLVSMLDQHKITYGTLDQSKNIKGYDYHQNRQTSITVTSQDLIIPVDQAKSILVRVLFEPASMLMDSLTYDITAWSLPFAYGLESIATKQIKSYNNEGYTFKSPNPAPTDLPYAFAFKRETVEDFKALSYLLEKGVNVRTNYEKIISDNVEIPSGSFVISLADNRNFKGDFKALMIKLSNDYGISLQAIKTGFSSKGPDLGSPKLKILKNTRVGLIFGDGASPYNTGEFWHLFEQQIEHPVIRINTQYAEYIDLSILDVLIMPHGNYGSLMSESFMQKIKSWVQNGGRLILIEGAMRHFVDQESFNLKKYLDEEEKETLKKLEDKENYLRRFEDDERLNIQDRINGGIYKVRLDNSHPLGFGYPDYYFTLKTRENRYSVLDNGWNVGTIQGDQDKVSGFAGRNTRDNTYNALILGMEYNGDGEVIYFVDNPIFRSFWENGKLLICNAVFMP